ncbi:lysylphosphatidylglycerol synthase domain-containing protein [Sulfurovum sp.]|uniref:lysylphosphatidylglycerol synthase domain-containing protein n=1 Tax=Sulfurovum sp. TaxID=1969726 RepID=UPI003569CE55
MKLKIAKLLLTTLGIALFLFFLQKSKILETGFSIIFSFNEVLFSVFFMALIPLVRAYRWMLLSNVVLSRSIKFKDSYLETGASFFVSIFTPAKVGDLSRVFLLKNRRTSLFLVVIYELWCDFCCLIVLSSGVILLFVEVDGYKSWLISFLVFIVIIPPVLAILLKIILPENGLFLSFYKILDGIGENLIIFHLKMISVSMFVGIFLVCSCYSLTYAKIENFGFFNLLSCVNFGQLLGVITFVPMGIGVRELSSLQIVRMLGFDTLIWSQIILILRCINMVNILAAFLCYLVVLKRYKM